MNRAQRLSRATAGLTGPLAALDLEAFDANAATLLARAGGLPVRLAHVQRIADQPLRAGFIHDQGGRVRHAALAAMKRSRW